MVENPNQVELNSAEQDHQALEALVVDNPALERLETILGRFNLFEAIGAVRRELGHSDFLAFLLDPAQNHGLGDEFLRRFLLKARQSTTLWPPPVSAINLSVWDLDDTLVLREWRNIDILLVNEQHRFVVVIENKIDSGEHSGQLDRYWSIATQQYPGWYVAGLYLTPAGATASAEAYASLDYVVVAELAERLAQARQATLDADVRMVLTHYAQLLRRHVVSESEMADLCREIYRKHRRALDLIYEYRPDEPAVIYDLLVGLIQSTPDLTLDQASKAYIRFAFTDWDVPKLTEGEGWTTSRRILLFQFNNAPDTLKLHLYIGPGPAETRNGLLALAKSTGAPFYGQSGKLGVKWHTIYLRPILTPAAYEDGDDDTRKAQILKQWTAFMKQDLPAMDAALRGQAWLGWPSTPATDSSGGTAGLDASGE